VDKIDMTVKIVRTEYNEMRFWTENKWS